MAIIYQFPFSPETDVSEEQRRIWDEEIQAIIDEADCQTEKIMAYIEKEQSDNPFEQMDRERAYNKLQEDLHRMTTARTRVPKIIIKDDTECDS